MKVGSLFTGYGLCYAVTMPKGQYDRTKSAWKPRPRITYDPAQVAEVRTIYEAGHTMREVSEMTGIGVKVLQRLMPRNGIERRPAIKRNQRGEANSSWRGDEATYQALHLRVRSERGAPVYCSCCGRADQATRYEWANQTGSYTDVADYEPMCCSCHKTFDATRRKLTGVRTMPHRAGDGDA